MKCGRVIVMGFGFLAAALGVGCGGAEGSSGSGTTDPCAESRNSAECLQALDDGCDKSEAAGCAAFFQCNPGLAPIYYGSVDTCTQKSAEQCKNVVRLGGTLASPADLEACAQGFVELPCSEAFRPECFVRGARSIGQACAANMECESRRCVVTVSGVSCGTCMAARTQGQLCDVGDGDCEIGLTCLSTTNTCELRLAEGAGCTTHNDCEGNLLCIAKKCAKPLNEGAPCSEDLCDHGLLIACDGTKCAKFATVGPGEACTFDWCVYGAACNSEGVCVSLPIEGQSCGTIRCVEPANCINGLCSLGYAVCQ